MLNNDELLFYLIIKFNSSILTVIVGRPTVSCVVLLQPLTGTVYRKLFVEGCGP